MVKNISSAIFGAILFLCFAIPPSLASQGSGCMPTTGTVSGLTLVQDINAGIAAIISSNSGATAPATDCTALAIKGQVWLDTSVTPNHLRIYDGTNWLDLGAVDSAGHLWKPPVGGGTETLASGTTTDLCSVAGSYVAISATTTITSFSNTCAAGTVKFLTFVSTPQVTYNASSLILPTAASIIAQAGDSAMAVYLGGGNWKVVAWTRADGTALSASSIFTGAVFFDSPISATVATNTNDWNPSGLSTSNVIRLNCSGASNITGMVAPGTDGKIIVVDSNLTSAASCILTSQDTNSTAANRFGFIRPISLRPGQSVSIKYDSNILRWRLIQELTAQPIAGGFKNMRVFNVATVLGDSAPATANNQMIVKADEITVEDVNGGAARLSTVSCTMDITSSGAGGLDTGSVAARTWYSEWVIFNPVTNTTSCLLSVSSTINTITLPSGYTSGARVGWNTTDASNNFMRVIQYGRHAHYAIVASTNTALVPNIANGTAGTYSGTSPILVAVQVQGNGFTVPTTAISIKVAATNTYKVGTVAALLVAASTAYGGTNNGPSGTNGQTYPLAIIGTSSYALGVSATIELESASIAWTSTAAGGGISAIGWEDSLN